MSKRVLALVCLLAMLLSMIVVPATAATEAEQATTYDVGYAIKNFNPWVSSSFDHTTQVGTAEFLENPEEVADKKIYPYLFSQNGNQIDWESVVTQLHDDNGDGNVDHNDGIFATCTAVTYNKGAADEKTVLFITTDTMKAWTNLVNAVRNKIVASAWAQELGITADEIMVSSNHTHSGPQLDGTFNYYIDTTVFDTAQKQAALKTDRENYYNWVVDRIVAAAEESIADQAPATMSKGSVDATNATAALNYNSGSGYHMNTIRHYERTLTASLLWWSGKISSIYANTEVPSHSKLVAQLNEYDHDGKTAFKYQDDYTTTWSTTDEADNTMYVLRFEFEDAAKDPVVFVNWRAHSTMNSGILNHSVLSGDYATGLRQVLADNNYRAAFFQGAAGNVVPHPTANVYTVDGKLQKDKMDWLYEATDKASSPTLDETKKTFVYGRMLAEVAQYCMEETAMVETPVGEIKTYQTSWKAEKQKYSDDLLSAAIALRAEVMSSQGWTQEQFDSNYRVFLQQKSSTYFPYYYKPSGSTTAIINSRLHFHSVYTQAKLVKDQGKTISNYTSEVELDAILLGENVAFITSPNELADYYHDFTGDVKSHTTADKEAHNDWAKLNDSTYGTPFFLGYSNQNSGYIANWLDFKANSADYATITGIGADGYMLYSPGTYESMTSDFAAGQGEALIDIYDQILDIAAEGSVEGTCPKCGDVEWTPLTALSTGTTEFGSGHYYLTEDVLRLKDEQTQKVVNDGDALCINLNGYTLETEGRSFNVHAGGEVSIIDTAVKDPGTGGVVRAYAEDNNPGGGLATVEKNGVFNLYGGTLEFVKEDDSQYGTGVGGIFSLTGTLNVYGGTIEGAELVDSKYPFGYDGSGGAIYMYGGAALNVYGGEITSGTLPTANDLPTAGGALKAYGPCVFASASTCRIKLSGSADVEDIYILFNNGSLLTVDGEYTGTTGITMGCSVSEGMDIGNITNNATFPNLTCVSPTTHHLRASGSDLILTTFGDDVVAAIGSTPYTDIQTAIDKSTSANSIKLLKDVTKDIVLNPESGNNVYMNLNGYDITGKITGTKTLYVMDSTTDDYTVADGVYGKITGEPGVTVKGFTQNKQKYTYLKVEEDDGISFHKLNLTLSTATLRAQTDGEAMPSLYYGSEFKGDEKVVGLVKEYGVVMSVKGEPTAANMESDCKYSTFTEFKSGSSGNSANGTLLKGIMKPTNARLVNNRNSQMSIYGKAYVKTTDGTLYLGENATRTLQEQTEDIDTKWSSLTDTQKQGIAKMYDTYKSIVSKWNVPNLSTAMGATQDGALKVLIIGNSHGLDATNLLYEVFKDQGYDEQELVLGALYYSGCNMTQHATFMTNEQAKYDYHENDGSNADGSWNVQSGVTADVALNAHQWDIVILQQMNHRAGVDSTAAYYYSADDFKTVINYVREHQNGIPKFGWHMVWTNPDQDEYWDPSSSLSHPTKTDTVWKDTNDQLYPGADGTYDQALMYQGVVACTQKYIEGDESFLGEDVFDFVIPSATSVEYAQDVLGLSQAQIYRDYTHMNDYGRLIAAYTWYAKIMELDQIPAVGIDAIPAVLHHSKSEYPSADSGYAVTDDMKKLIRNAVNYALDNPYELPSEEDNTVSILGIGNSYTIDSMWMLGEVYQAENPGKNVKLGIAYRSGETLSGHVTNISAGNTYHYLYWDSATDTWTVTAEQTLQQILKAQKWETVSMQQGSSGSGRATTYNGDIQTIQTYVKEQLGYTPTFTWNMTWAYPMEDIEDNYTLENAPNANSFTTYYQNSQAVMYKAIVDAVQTKILPDATFEYLMPVGTAIQNANATLTDFELYRDYTHLSDLSRLMAAYTWYCELELVTLDEIQLSALPTVNCSSSSWYNGAARDLTETEFQLVVDCVKAAMQDNFTTTDPYVYEE